MVRRASGHSASRTSLCAGRLVALQVTLVSSLAGGAAEAETRPPSNLPSSPLMIQDDVGGNLVAYAQRVSLIHLSGRPVALAGRCDSACTLYLSLPRSQNCVLEGVSFGFHEAFGGRPDMNAWGTRYLLDAYPEWVHDWLERRGGLGLELKRMPYTEAARHLRKCPDRKADAG